MFFYKNKNKLFKNLIIHNFFYLLTAKPLKKSYHTKNMSDGFPIKTLPKLFYNPDSNRIFVCSLFWGIGFLF